MGGMPEGDQQEVIHLRPGLSRLEPRGKLGSSGNLSAAGRVRPAEPRPAQAVISAFVIGHRRDSYLSVGNVDSAHSCVVQKNAL